MADATFSVATARARKRIVRDFVAARATAADRAITYVAPDAPAGRHVFQKLTRFGAIVEIEPGRFWLDPARLAVFRRSMRRRAAAVVATLGLVAATALALGE